MSGYSGSDEDELQADLQYFAFEEQRETAAGILLVIIDFTVKVN